MQESGLFSHGQNAALCNSAMKMHLETTVDSDTVPLSDAE